MAIYMVSLAVTMDAVYNPARHGGTEDTEKGFNGNSTRIDSGENRIGMRIFLNGKRSDS